MTPEEQARALGARGEHGDEVHRQWLRDIAVPDLIAALTPGPPEVMAERAVVEAAIRWKTHAAVGELMNAVAELIRLRDGPERDTQGALVGNGR